VNSKLTRTIITVGVVLDIVIRSGVAALLVQFILGADNA